MDSRLRKQVLRLLSNGMYVITARDGERLVGATITWLTQASFEPPLLVAGIRPDSALHAALADGGRALVQVLAAGQEHVAKAFFTRADLDEEASPPTINGMAYRETPSGALLEETRAWAECRVRERIETGGDHDLIVFEVVDVGTRDGSEPVAPLTVQASPWQYGG